MTALALHLVVADPDSAATWYADPSGYRWALDQHVRDVPREEVARRVADPFGGSVTS